MTDAEQREAARQFVNRWMGKGKEDEDGRSYWIDLLTNVLGMDNVTERLNFEKKVVIDGNTKRITMPAELRRAHTASDKAVMAAYGFSTKMTEADCVGELMKLYQKMQ